MFHDVKVELGLRMELPSLDLYFRWSSIFNMIREFYAARRVLSAFVAKQEDLVDLNVSKSEWKLVKKCASFWRHPPSATEHLPGLEYVTI